MASADIVRTWAQLETWARNNLPGLLAELNGPAEPPAITRLEATLGFGLPPDFRTSLGLHDGETGDGALLDSGGQLLDVRGIEDDLELERQALRGYADLMADTLSGPAQRTLYSPRRVPITDFNRDEIWLLDLDPAPGGQVGQVLKRDVEGGKLEVVAPSFGQFLSDYLQRLATGRAQFPKAKIEMLRQVPPDQGALKARLQRFSQALRAQRGLDLRREQDGSEVEMVGSLALPTPGMAPAEYPFMTGTSRVILRGDLGLSSEDIMACNLRDEGLLYRVRGVVRKRLSRQGREEATLELKWFKPFD